MIVFSLFVAVTTFAQQPCGVRDLPIDATAFYQQLDDIDQIIKGLRNADALMAKHRTELEKVKNKTADQKEAYEVVKARPETLAAINDKIGAYCMNYEFLQRSLDARLKGLALEKNCPTDLLTRVQTGVSAVQTKLKKDYGARYPCPLAAKAQNP